MLNKKCGNRVPPRSRHLFLPLLLLLAGCSTTHIPGLDRVLFPNSSAKVGPLIDTEEQYPTGQYGSEPAAKSTEQASAATDEAGVASTANKPLLRASEQEKIVETQAASPVTELEPEPKPKAVSQAAVNDEADQTAIQQALKRKEWKERKERKEQKAPKVAPNTIAKGTMLEKDSIESGAVSGQVSIIADDGQSISAEGTLITLTPKKSTGELEKRQPKTHVIDMEGKEYQPQYSTINAGDQVVFVNKDNIQHNVFSPSGNNAFDLGTYGAGLKRAVTLSDPGIVKVYCNIHADMATFVAVADPGMSVKADDRGRYRIDNVPPGAYEMTIWNIRGETTRTLEIKPNETAKLVDRIDTAAVKAETHKNKFGGNYSKNSALFEDEFY